ncbi:MAG: hypothetical protein H0X24_09805 [Ktedonobacterales bacterium]|nr:hypothetical protein [Ktedonobacterales bacterium]
MMLRVWASKVALAVMLAVALFVGGSTLGPTQAATQKAPALTLTFTCASAVDYSYGQICVHTHAGMALAITVHYCSGYNAVSNSLKGTRYANSAGNASWAWRPMTKCRGMATATVRGIWHGITLWRIVTFKVR